MLSPIQFIKNKSLTSKLILTASLLCLPIILLLYFFIQSSNFRIDFAEKETEGANFLLSIYPIQQNIAQHRGLMQGYLNGATEFESKIRNVGKTLHNDLTKVITDERTLRFNSLSELEIINQKWTLISGQRNIDSRVSFDQHTQLIQRVLKFTTLIADQSNLTLDPEIDSFYLMDLATITLPQLFEALGKTRGAAAGIAASGNLTQDNLIILTSFQFEINKLLNKTKKI